MPGSIFAISDLHSSYEANRPGVMASVRDSSAHRPPLRASSRVRLTRRQAPPCPHPIALNLFLSKDKWLRSSYLSRKRPLLFSQGR